MTSEKQFNAWRQQEFTYLHDDLIEPMKTAWLEATRLAYEDVVRICEEKIDYQLPIPCPDGKKDCLVRHTVLTQRRRDADECIEAIQARLKELMP